MSGPRVVARVAPLVCVLLGGCTGLLQSSTKPEQIYYLRAPGAGGAGATAVVAAGAPAPGAAPSLRVGHPVAAPGLDTPHIVLVQADHRMNYYTGSRWPATIPYVVESLVVETLRGSGRWSSVEDSASPFPSDYLLQLRVRRFEADYTAGGGAPLVEVLIDCIIGRREGRDVIATFTAAGSAPAAANRLGEVVAAFEQASDAALSSLSQQAAAAVQGDAERAAQNGANPVPSMRR